MTRISLLLRGLVLPALFASAVQAAPVLRPLGPSRGGPVVVPPVVVHPTGIPIPPPRGGPVVTHPIPPAPAPSPSPSNPVTLTVRDATRRMNALRALAPKVASAVTINPVTAGYSPVKFSMSVPDNLGRPPTSSDVTINAGLDGLSPQAALAAVKSHLTTPVAQSNSRFVDQTILATHKAFTIGVNNAFTAGSPSNKFITTTLAGAQVTILGTMSAMNPTVIMAKLPTDAVSRFYVPNGAGGFSELPSLPYSVLMKAKLQNGVTGGVRVNYTTWGSNVLDRQITTITEQGSTQPPGTTATAN